MEEKNLKLETSIRNSGFSALLCTALGFILFEAWVIQLRGKPIAHAIILPFGVLLTYAIYRAVAGRYAIAETNVKRPVRNMINKLPSMACGALLAVFGYAVAVVLSSGSMTILALFIACACTFPWSKIPLCRSHILVPAVIVTVAMVLGLPSTDRLPHPFVFPLGAWMLWMGAVLTWLMNIFFRRLKSKVTLPATPQRAQEPATAVEPQ